MARKRRLDTNYRNPLAYGAIMAGMEETARRITELANDSGDERLRAVSSICYATAGAMKRGESPLCSLMLHVNAWVEATGRKPIPEIEAELKAAGVVFED